MKNPHFIRLQPSALLVVTFSIISLFFTSNSVITVSAQTTDKTERIIKKELFKNEPIEFAEIKTQEKTVNIKQQFTQEYDWLKTLQSNSKTFPANQLFMFH